MVLYRTATARRGLGQVEMVLEPAGDQPAMVVVRTWWPARTRQFVLPLGSVARLEDLTALTARYTPPADR